MIEGTIIGLSLALVPILLLAVVVVFPDGAPSSAAAGLNFVTNATIVYDSNGGGG